MPFRKGGPNPKRKALSLEHEEAKSAPTAKQKLDESPREADVVERRTEDQVQSDGQALYNAICTQAKPGVWYLIPRRSESCNPNLQGFTVAKLLRRKPSWVHSAFRAAQFFRKQTSYPRIVRADAFSGRPRDGTWFALDQRPTQTVAEQLNLLTRDQQLLDKQYGYAAGWSSSVAKPDRPRLVPWGAACLMFAIHAIHASHHPRPSPPLVAHVGSQEKL